MSFNWSYSSIKTFQQCPKKYYHLKIAKDVKDEGSEATIYGQELHKAAEDFIKEGKPLPLELLKDYYKELSYSSIEERKHLYQFRDDRADVIVPAGEIFVEIMKWLKASEIFIPKVGLGDGIVREVYKEYLNGKSSNL